MALTATTGISCCRRKCVGTQPSSRFVNEFHAIFHDAENCGPFLRWPTTPKALIYVNVRFIWIYIERENMSGRHVCPRGVHLVLTAFTMCALFAFILNKQKRQYCVCTSLGILTSVRPVESILSYRLNSSTRRALVNGEWRRYSTFFVFAR